MSAPVFLVSNITGGGSSPSWGRYLVRWLIRSFPGDRVGAGEGQDDLHRIEGIDADVDQMVDAVMGRAATMKADLDFGQGLDRALLVLSLGLQCEP